jgi:hypothetical protein
MTDSLSESWHEDFQHDEHWFILVHVEIEAIAARLAGPAALPSSELSPNFGLRQPVISELPICLSVFSNSNRQIAVSDVFCVLAVAEKITFPQMSRDSRPKSL